MSTIVRMSLPPTPEKPLATVAHNIRRLLEIKKWTQGNLAEKSGVSLKMIGNIVNQKESVSITRLWMIAETFRVPPWFLLVPNIPDEMLERGNIEKVFRDYINSPQEGKEYITRVAEKEASYGKKK